MNIWYVDSSVLIRAIDGSSPAAKKWFLECIDNGDYFVDSRMLEVEVMRFAINSKQDVATVQEYLDRFDYLEITKEVVEAALTIAAPVGGADSIHVATAARIAKQLAIAARFQLVIATHDVQMATAARSLGLNATDPVVDDSRRPPVA